MENMKWNVCPNCGVEVHPDAQYCPYCGADLTNKKIIEHNELNNTVVDQSINFNKPTNSDWINTYKSKVRKLKVLFLIATITFAILALVFVVLINVEKEYSYDQFFGNIFEINVAYIPFAVLFGFAFLACLILLLSYSCSTHIKVEKICGYTVLAYSGMASYILVADGRELETKKNPSFNGLGTDRILAKVEAYATLPNGQKIVGIFDYRNKSIEIKAIND